MSPRAPPGFLPEPYDVDAGDVATYRTLRAALGKAPLTRPSTHEEASYEKVGEAR